MINRREFLETVAALVPALGWQGAPANEWGSLVFDLHFHLRPRPAANLAHLDGAGVTKANLLTRGAVLEQVKALQAASPNLFGDLAANSGNNAMSRDAEFTAGFLKRHQDKLLFGSDCGCADGRGGGVSQNNNPAAARMAGKCVARETLTLLKRATSADVFQKIVWGNVHTLLRIPT